MNDFFDNFDDEMADGFENRCNDEPCYEDEYAQEDEPTESDQNLWDGPGENDWAIIFPLAEEIAREKREKERIRRKSDKKDNEP